MKGKVLTQSLIWHVRRKEEGMDTKLRHKVIAWVLMFCLTITLIPNAGHAAKTENKPAGSEKASAEKISPDEVSEKNVIEKKESVTTYDLGQGETMSVFHGGDVRYKDDSGKLVDYDPSLVAIANGEKTEQNESLEDYIYKNRQGDKKQYMPQLLSEETPILMEKESYRIEITPSSKTLKNAGIKQSEVKLEKEKVPTIYEDEEKLPVNALYGDERKPAVFKYTSGDNGIKETIVLNEKPESNVFEYVLKTGSLKAKKNSTSEGITIYDDSTDEIIAAIAPPWMNDAGGEAYSEDITYDLSEGEEDGSYILKMTVDSDYLNDSERKYPVTIDPTTTWTGSSQMRDVYVISGSYAGTNFYDSGTVVMPAGSNSTGIHETYIQFVNLQSQISGKNISSAVLSAYEVSGGENGQTVGAFRVTGSWSPSSLTYNNRPSCESSAMSSIRTQPAAVAHALDILPYVKGVANGTASDNGVALKNITASPGYAVFFGSRSSYAMYRPKLTVTYSEEPPAATGAQVSPAYVKNSTDAKLTFSGLSSAGIARAEYKLTAYDEASQSEGSVIRDFSEDTTITSGSSLPVLEAGCYKVYVRGVSSSGAAGEAVSAGILHVDNTAPEIGSAALKNSSGEDIKGKWTQENNPVIEFSGVTDEHIDASAVSYAVKAKGTPVSDSDFKAPVELSINETKPYSGSFRFVESDRSLTSGSYTIHVKASDKAGNEKIRRLSYQKDVDDPLGSLILTDLVTGNEVTQIYKPVNIEVGVSGTGSPIKESTLKLYKLTTNQAGTVTGVDSSSVKTLTKNITISENIVMDTLDVCDSYGKYRLVLYLKDSVGRTKEITKDFEVTYTLPVPDKVQIEHSKGGTATMVWGFSYTPQQKIKLGSIEGMFPDDEDFKTLVPAGENGTLPFDGSATINVPNEEGEWEVVIRGKSKNGHPGEEMIVPCVVDKTAPEVKDITFNQCYLQGTVKDDNLKEWTVYAKEKDASAYNEEPVAKGSSSVYNYLIAYIDINKAPFEENKEYTLKIVATDKAGNKTEKTTDMKVPSDNTKPKIIEAGLEIDKGESNLPYKGSFIVGSDKERLSVVGDVPGVVWYIANRESSPALKDENGNALYDALGWWDVLALKKESDGSRKYSVPVMENGYKNSISFSGSEISGNTGTKNFSSHDSVLSFRIKAQSDAAVYQIKANAVQEGQYVTIQPDTTYYVTDLTGSSAFAYNFDIKVTAAEGQSISDIPVIFYGDTSFNESFIYSNVEDFAPKRLSVEDKLNYKTYLKWDIPDDLPDNISYEVYRSTNEDFIPDESTRVASDIKAGYYTEINAWHGKDHYYKVCAVKKYSINTGVNREDRSSFTETMAGRATDPNESVKRLGIKDFWEFTEFNTPNGNGYIEKSSGNFVYQQNDAQIPNEGFDIKLMRTYNSQSSSRGTFGSGWSHDYDMELINVSENNTLDFTHVVLKDGNGTIYHFTRGTGDEHFISSFGSYVNLTAEQAEQNKTVTVSSGGSNTEVTLRYQFMLHTKDGLKYYFNSGGQLILMEENNGNFVIFEHDAKKGVLSAMRTNNDITLQFIYNDGKNGTDPLTVKEVRMPDGSRIEYEYTKPLLSSERLLTKVTEVSGEDSIEYVYEYDKPLLSSQPRNLTCIKEAQNKNKYDISYDFDTDQVKEVKYPDGEKFTFEYAEDNTSTITKKYSGGQVVLGEKDFFDRVYGKCEKSIRGAEDVSVLNGTDETGLDVMTRTYQDNQLIQTTNTAQYYEINSSGYIVEKSGVKENKAKYSGSTPVTETEDDGTVSEYTYYTAEDGANLDELIKTVKETNGDGKVTEYKKYSYDQSGNVTETIDYVAGTKITNTYHTEGDFKGELASMTESLITVNDAYEITSESVKSTSSYAYQYNTADGVTQKTESCTQSIPKPDGTTETITTGKTYDVMGRLIRETDSRGYQTSSTYDGFGRLTATTYKYADSNQLKQSTAKEYDKNGMVTYEKLEDGIEKWYTYDSMGRVTNTKIKKGDSEENINTTYRYQDVSIYQGKGNDTVSVNNAYVTKQTYADGTIISETYTDHKGNVVRSYQGGLYTDMTYSLQGDLVTKWIMGQTLSGTDGLLEIYIYDDKGNLTATVTDPDYEPGTNTTGYKVREDSTGSDGSQIQGSIVSRSSYDADGNATEKTDPLGNTTHYAYDRSGNLLSVTLPDNVKYEYQYDVSDTDRTTKDVIIEPRTVKQGNETVTTTAKSIVVKDSTDKTIRVEDLGVSETDGTSISTSYEYDARDNLIKATDKKGNYRAYTYDVRDRLTAVDYYDSENGSAVKSLRCEFTYDDADNMTSMTDKKHVDGQDVIYRYTAYEYDDFNRLISVAECDTDALPSDEILQKNRITYGYDGKDRLVSIDYPDCALGVSGLKFTYNIHGWLTEVDAVRKNGSDRTLREYTYTEDGKVETIKDYTDFLNGLTGTGKWLKRTYTYDRLNRPTGIIYTDSMSGSSTAVKQSHIYTYDKNSNITSEDVIDRYGTANSTYYGQRRDYSYDVNDRLTVSSISRRIAEDAMSAAESHYYSYDAAGNKTSDVVQRQRSGSVELVSNKYYTYNEFNQLTAVDGLDMESGSLIGKTYAYDANGNQISETDQEAGKQTVYEYDADNRLRKATGRTGETVDYVQENQYNGFGQRVQKKEGSDVTEYFYDGSTVLYTEDAQDKVTSFNLIGAEDNILQTARADRDDAVNFYTYTKDLRESTINIVGADGTSQVTYDYDDYGETKTYDKDSASPFYNEVCYTAGIYDKTTGLYNLNARYYDPENGVFMTQDTYRGSRSRTATLNLYAYCTGNPVKYTDPSGHWIWGVVGAALGAYDGYKYAKKKKLKGWKKAAAIVGGATLGAVNPFKVVKVAKTGYKAYKAAKYTKTAVSTVKKSKTVVKVVSKAKPVIVAKKTVRVKAKPRTTIKLNTIAASNAKQAKAACFTAGTKIYTEKGFKNIEKIKAGDYVWSENPETKEKALKQVKKIFVREKDSIVRLAINGEVIETTSEHPFYVEGKGWRAAGELTVGTEVRLEDGSAGTVTAKEDIQLEEPVTVYNFEVEDYHTYYVSEYKALVHNMCAMTLENAPANIASKSSYASGAEGEAELAKIVGGGKPHKFFSTTLGNRFVDLYSDAGIAHESKVGYTALTKRVKTQILKDEELIGEEIKGAHWHFFRSSITGKIGPSEPLKKFLEERGIKYTIHY